MYLKTADYDFASVLILIFSCQFEDKNLRVRVTDFTLRQWTLDCKYNYYVYWFTPGPGRGERAASCRPGTPACRPPAWCPRTSPAWGWGWCCSGWPHSPCQQGWASTRKDKWLIRTERQSRAVELTTTKLRTTGISAVSESESSWVSSLELCSRSWSWLSSLEDCPLFSGKIFIIWIGNLCFSRSIKVTSVCLKMPEIDSIIYYLFFYVIF